MHNSELKACKESNRIKQFRPAFHVGLWRVDTFSLTDRHWEKQEVELCNLVCFTSIQSHEFDSCMAIPTLFQLQEHFHCQALICSDFQPMCSCPLVHRESMWRTRLKCQGPQQRTLTVTSFCRHLCVQSGRSGDIALSESWRWENRIKIMGQNWD